MRRPSLLLARAALCLAALTWPCTGFATDVDGPGDCDRTPIDFGDAPEGIPAYPGVLAAFPTCIAPGPVGTRTTACAPISTAPGAAGFVRHAHPSGEPLYWLGCLAGGGGIDSEPDGKVAIGAGSVSACNPAVVPDCVETAFGIDFGQDECYGSTDAGLVSALTFEPCSLAVLDFNAFSCAPAAIDVYLNVLVDWNQDGDWNDNFSCPAGCAYEWAVKNVKITLRPGCNPMITPKFLSGPSTGSGWLRITLSDGPVSDDFPWAGSAGGPGGIDDLVNGETEDYPVTIAVLTGGNCPDYDDYGDAPEEAQAYPGVPGRFPTCTLASLPGTQTSACVPLSTPPGPTGYVRHFSGPNDPKFWFGCGDPAAGSSGVDSEADGKMNDTGAPPSACNPVQIVDFVENAFTLSFGQDEGYNDPDFDAGIRQPVSFASCSYDSVTFFVRNCSELEGIQAYLNVLIDMNHDGDWNDNFQCPPPGPPCAYEWAVKNQPISIPFGCSSRSTGPFAIGPNAGDGWMRLTLSLQPVSDDFPWRGSEGAVNGALDGGETEDYPVTITGVDTCAVAYEDFGDAPEGITAYVNGVTGNFPTCLSPGNIGTQELECGTLALSTPPGPAGYVRHVAFPADAQHFWLGCGSGVVPLQAIDSEADGKVNVGAPFGGPSACDPAVLTDCVENLIGLGMNQDECVGDLDAGIGTPAYFRACSLGTVTFSAYNCGDHDVPAHLNLLIDWNHDGDWNDVLSVLCSIGICAPEWAVKNQVITLAPGCNTFTTPVFNTGPSPGRAWMRLSISTDPALDDFPWNGSAGMPGGVIAGGETEDYAVNVVVPSTSGAGADEAIASAWLGPPVPNPARGDVALTFGLPRDAEVALDAFDLAGRRVSRLTRGRMSAGVHRETWNFRDRGGAFLPPGIYVLKLRVGADVRTRQVIRVP